MKPRSGSKAPWKQVRYMPTNIPGAPPGVVYYTTVIEVDNQRSPKGWRHVAGAFAAGVHGPLSLVPFLRAEPDFSWILRPGMTATVDIIRRKHRNVWKLPTEALNQLPDRSFVSSAAWRRWKEEEPEGWNTVWILDKEKGPQPVFVRVRGVNAQGETGIRDGQYNEVLEWEKGFTPSPDNPPKVIISFPQIEQGIFDKPTKIGLG
ncbi:MAG: hypothetical protein KatS3mg105_0103 [Gemmatales bacterium]|nr:MAG: hypothetical protein KatS3mg105_0103 [Gemmatales bacterium]